MYTPLTEGLKPETAATVDQGAPGSVQMLEITFKQLS